MAQAKVVETIDLTPTWKTAAHIYMTALVNGTAEGRRAGQEGILEMAAHLDRINAENKSDTDDS
jgi:hypothetical protein